MLRGYLSNDEIPSFDLPPPVNKLDDLQIEPELKKLIISVYDRTTHSVALNVVQRNSVVPVEIPEIKPDERSSTQRNASEEIKPKKRSFLSFLRFFFRI